MTERITFVELDLRRCANTYGQSPCTAALGVTGAKKCFNSFGTCQDTANFADETVTARYSTVTSTPSDIDAIPNIASVSIRPAKLELGESIGIRASINITFMDSRYPDTGPEGDRYLADRNYDPYTQGTYWGKFRARFPFVRGSAIRLIRGSTDQSLAQMETRHFIVEAVAGPNSNGSFTIKCKDVLNLAKGKQAQAPLLSNGTNKTSITATDTVIELSPVGIGDEEYPVSGLVNVGGKELCTFTRTGDFIVITRGQNNTEAITHNAGVRVQLCTEYSIQKVSAIIEDLLKTYAGINPSLIPAKDWLSEDDNYIDRNYSGIIAEPTAVDKLINELLVQTASTIWWDDINQIIKFRDTFSAKDQPNKRVSQVWTYYAQINPLEKLDEIQNYSSTVVTVSDESEADFAGEKSIKTIFSRWIPLGSDAASRLNQLILSRYTTPPRLISFGLQRDVNLKDPQLGGGYNCENFTLQTDEGAPETVPIQLLQVKSSDSGFNLIGEEVLYSQTISPDDPTTKDIPIDTSLTNIDLFLYATNAGFTFNTGDTANFTVYGGVTVGSNSTATPSMVTGEVETGVGVGDGWPAGVVINIINNGNVFGKGGNGAVGGSARSVGEFGGAGEFVTDGAIGGDGGIAIKAEYDCSVVNNGVVGGGGGGGGGGASMVVYGEEEKFETNALSGGGGGGGAGRNSSAGGLAGSATRSGRFPAPALWTGVNGTAGIDDIEGAGGRGGIGDLVITLQRIGGRGGLGGELGQDGESGTIATSGDLNSSPGAGGSHGLGINHGLFNMVISGNPILGGIG